ncbi:hypothetical protein E0H26_24260 [Micromonospora zingiberis]|uniref:Uncharacterized protein n=1 Tax=Micromonospora zingiberis TaxID=2053011 RepID=A0A4R0G7D9_9ACTN|nr:hypothetical protein [Micromonospora zingiberis]TCB92097.1 hypothetical protein E0H26_24260 [Micromonospora zingiberis]
MPQDADHAHLYRLLAMLPGPENRLFWQGIANCNDASLQYVYEKMGHIARFRSSVTPDGPGGYSISYLCKYLMIFFGGNRDSVNEEVGRELFATGAEKSYMGSSFTQDLVDTAWRLVVRHRSTDDNKLREWRNAQRNLLQAES